VGTGQRVYTVLSLLDENKLPNPWGTCDPAREKTLKLDFYSQYTRAGCMQECYRKEIVNKCGCVPFNHILNIELETVRECGPMEVINCAMLRFKKLKFQKKVQKSSKKVKKVQKE